MKINQLYIWHPKRSFNNGSYGFAFSLLGEKRGSPTAFLSVGVRELKNGMVSLDLLDTKLRALATCFNDLLLNGNIKGRKSFIKQLQKSLRKKRV